MSNTNNIEQAITDAIQSEDRKIIVNKSKIISYIDICALSLKGYIKFFETIVGNKTVASQMFAERNPVFKNSPAIFTYQKIYKELEGTAKNSETAHVFLSFINAMKAYLEAIDTINDQLTKLLENENLTIYNTRVSHLAVLSLLVEIDFFCQFMQGFIGWFCHETSSKAAPAPAPYTLSAFVEYQRIANDINQVVNYDARAWARAISEIKNDHNNFLLVADDNTSNVGFISSIKNIFSNGVFANGVKSLAIFRMLGDRRVDAIDRKMRKLKIERDLLDAQTALKRMDLDNMDKSSPEYKRLAKIIENYSNMIARMDQELATWYGDN